MEVTFDNRLKNAASDCKKWKIENAVETYEPFIVQNILNNVVQANLFISKFKNFSED